jgi:hypothetical protein
MSSDRHKILGVLAGSLLFAGFGCGGGKPAVVTSSEEATVTGTVKVRGQLVTKGDVLFDPSNYLRNVPVRSAPIGPDGTYKVTTLVGPNIVRIALAPDALPPNKESPQTDAEEPDANRESVEYEQISFDVQKGENVLNIELPQPK